jgi:queuine tRNA-ribosyltransferase
MFEIITTDRYSRARLGRLQTPHGVVETPSYVIVGTNAQVRTLEPEDLISTKTQMIIANTYHLWRSLGDAGLNDYIGLHTAMHWQGPIITDSGGFQVFSYGFLREQGMRRIQAGDMKELQSAPEKNLTRITEAGVYFRPEDQPDGEEAYLDAETSIKIQEQLGADIIVAFDEPTSPMNDHEYTKAAMERTHRWAQRSIDAKESTQLMYGVVQGGAFEDLRKESARTIGAMPFDGFAIGSTYGDSYGGTKAQTADMLRWAIPELPELKPRHLFGVGRIEDLFAGVEAGIDTFDCVIPTREARHGAIWTGEGRFDVTKGSYKDDESQLEEGCLCPSCSDNGITRSQLHDLFKKKDPRAGRYATIHNVFFFNNFMEQMREALRAGKFQTFKNDSLKRLAK